MYVLVIGLHRMTTREENEPEASAVVQAVTVAVKVDQVFSFGAVSLLLWGTQNPKQHQFYHLPGFSRGLGWVAGWGHTLLTQALVMLR